MEPFSAAASAIALVELAGKVSKVLYKYLNQVRSAKTDTQRLICEVGLVQSILEDAYRLHKTVTTCKSGRRFSNGEVKAEYNPRLKTLRRIEDLGGENGPFKVCEKALVDIMAKLQPLAENRLSLRQKLLWPFESKYVDKLVQLLERQREIIDSGLSVVQATSVFDIADGSLRVEDGLEDDRIKKRRENILKWLKLGNVNPFARQDELRRVHGKGTNQWLLNSEQFTTWRDQSNSILWINAILGAGNQSFARL